MTTFPFYADPGHGWLKVSKRQLEMVGLTPDSFTPYSYKRGNSFFLEEDDDASLFIQSWVKSGRTKYGFKTYHGNKQSRIRNYERINSKGFNR